MKIDIYVREPGEKGFSYKYSTCQALTCRAAKAKFVECYPAYAAENVRTRRVPEAKPHRVADEARLHPVALVTDGNPLFKRVVIASQAYQDAVARIKAAELDLRGLRLDRKQAAGEYDAAAALFYSEAPRTSAG